MEKPELNKDKLDAAIHYVVARVEKPTDLGAVKLHKVLWFTDLELMYTGDKTLCGETFIKMPQGPWGTHVNKSIKRLENAGLIAEGEGSYFGHRQRQFFSLLRPNLDLFTGGEVDILNRMIDAICFGHTARSISEASHDVVWHRTQDRGVMPATCVFESLISVPDEDDLRGASKPLDPSTEADLAALGVI